MRIRRLEQLVERAEKAAKEPSINDLLLGLGYFEMDGVWVGPETYFEPFADKVIAWSRAMNEATEPDVEKLTKEFEELRRVAVQRYLDEKRNSSADEKSPAEPRS